MTRPRAAHLALALAMAWALGACGPCREPPLAPTVASPTPAPSPEPTPIDASNALSPLPAGARLELLDQAFASDQGRASLEAAVGESIAWVRTQPDSRQLVFGPITVGARAHERGLRRFAELLATAPDAAVLAERVLAEFDVLESVGDEDGLVLFTGYYEPAIEASLERSKHYQVPIYRIPSDRIVVDLSEFSEDFGDRKIVGRIDGKRLIPYWERQAIEREQPLARRGFEIAWAKDPVDLFFVEVQGSGTLLLPDGSERRIGYAGSNGRSYRSIGKLLIDEGLVPRERMSMQAIRKYLTDNPAEIERVLFYNSSFVFFRFLKGAAVGSLGRPVTAGRTIATDRRLFPFAALAYIVTSRPLEQPDGTVTDGAELRGYVLNQDTGGAIRGPDRADLFWGRGAEAAEMAGLMKQQGKMYFLVPKAR